MLLSTILSTSRHFHACFITGKSTVKAVLSFNEMDIIWVMALAIDKNNMVFVLQCTFKRS